MTSFFDEIYVKDDPRGNFSVRGALDVGSSYGIVADLEAAPLTRDGSGR